MIGSRALIAEAVTMQRRILHSWKEIASYVGRGIRTIQRYEVQFGLPVHRPAGSARSAVMAFSDEIDAWLSRTPTHSRQVINLIVKPSEMRSKTVLNGNRASNGIDTCPLCCGAGKISNSKHVEPGPGSESIPQTEN
jgi:hypothetical protein